MASFRSILTASSWYQDVEDVGRLRFGLLGDDIVRLAVFVGSFALRPPPESNPRLQRLAHHRKQLGAASQPGRVPATRPSGVVVQVRQHLPRVGRNAIRRLHRLAGVDGGCHFQFVNFFFNFPSTVNDFVAVAAAHFEQSGTDNKSPGIFVPESVARIVHVPHHR